MCKTLDSRGYLHTLSYGRIHDPGDQQFPEAKNDHAHHWSHRNQEKHFTDGWWHSVNTACLARLKRLQMKGN